MAGSALEGEVATGWRPSPYSGILLATTMPELRRGRLGRRVQAPDGQAQMVGAKVRLGSALQPRRLGVVADLIAGGAHSGRAAPPATAVL